MAKGIFLCVNRYNDLHTYRTKMHTYRLKLHGYGLSYALYEN